MVVRRVLAGKIKSEHIKKLKEKCYKCYFPLYILVLLDEDSLQDCLELPADRAIDEEVDGGIDGEKEMVGAGEAEVPGGADEQVAAPGRGSF